MNQVSRVTFFFILAVLAYSVAAILTVSDNGFQNGTEDINMLMRGEMMYARPSTIFQPDEMGRNNIAAYLLLGGLYRIFGLHPFYYYAVLLALHILVSLSVVALGYRILGHSLGAMAGGIFFLVLSIHFQTIGWLENLGRVFMTLLSLLALICFDDFRRNPRTVKILSVYFLWFVALNFAEEAFVFPFLVLAYDMLVLRNNPFSRPLTSKLFIYLPLVLMQGFFFLFQFTLYGDAMRQYVTWKPDLPEKLLGMVWSFMNLFVPRREALMIFLNPGLVTRMIIPGVVFIPVLYFAFRFRDLIVKDRRFLYLLVFCLLWFGITFLPYSLRPLKVGWREYPHPRYLYWPIMGLSFLMGWLVDTFLKGVVSLDSRKLRLAGYAGATVATLYFYLLNVWTYCFMVDKLCRAGCR